MDVDKAFMEELGKRIAHNRKQLGMNQTELAGVIVCSQPTMATYELGTRRIPVAFLPKLASLFEMTTDELLGHAHKVAKKKRGPPPKLLRQLQQVQQLPRSQQRVVMQMLDGLLAKAS